MLYLFTAPSSLKHLADNVLVDMLITTVVVALGFHYWSARMQKRLQQNWSEAKAGQVLNMRLGMLTIWVILVWALLIVGLVKWLR